MEQEKLSSCCWISDGITISCELPVHLSAHANLLKDILYFSAAVDESEKNIVPNQSIYVSTDSRILLDEAVFNSMTKPFSMPKEDLNVYFNKQSIEILKNSYRWYDYLQLDHYVKCACAYALLKKYIAHNNELKNLVGGFKKTILSFYLFQSKIKTEEQTQQFILLKTFTIFASNCVKACNASGLKNIDIQGALEWKYCITELSEALNKIPTEKKSVVALFNGWFTTVYFKNKKLKSNNSLPSSPYPHIEINDRCIQKYLRSVVFKEDQKADLSYTIFPEEILGKKFFDRVRNVNLNYAMGNNITLADIRSSFPNLVTVSCIGMQITENDNKKFGPFIYFNKNDFFVRYKKENLIVQKIISSYLLRLIIDEQGYNDLQKQPYFNSIQKNTVVKKLDAIKKIIIKNNIFKRISMFMLIHHLMLVMGFGLIIPSFCIILDHGNLFDIFNQFLERHYIAKVFFVIDFFAPEVLPKFRFVLYSAYLFSSLEYLYYFISLAFYKEYLIYDYIYTATIFFTLVLSATFLPDSKVQAQTKQDIQKIWHIIKAKGLPEIVVV
ncbi:hypothetical protein EKK58_10750 [Candidatus Dependentiae bacterium]|nr:MAG: hypothetical protein EKK58_10750 [Candidatus Dependentiae bacterium]